ncbi:hypothetical protein ACHAXH_006532 [Discostella pseudostelligera]
MTSPTDEEEDFFAKRMGGKTTILCANDEPNMDHHSHSALRSPGVSDMYSSMNVLLADAECAASPEEEGQHEDITQKIPHTHDHNGRHDDSGGRHTSHDDNGGVDSIELSRRNISSNKFSPVETSADIYSDTDTDKPNTEVSQSRYRRPMDTTTDIYSDNESEVDSGNGNYNQGRDRKRDHTNPNDTANDIYSNNDDEDNENDDYTEEGDEVSTTPSEAQSEASFMVLLRYIGLSSRPYGVKQTPKQRRSLKTMKEEESMDVECKHDLQVGDHVIRWKMLGYCYPMQVHGIVFSVQPDCVTIVDCGLSSSYSNVDKMGSTFGDREKRTKGTKRDRRRMNILTLVDAKEIKQWTKIRYGEEVELKVHSSNSALRSKTRDKDFLQNVPSDAEIEQSSSAGLELEEECLCDQAKIRKSPEKQQVGNKSGGAWLCSWQPALEKIESKEDETKPTAQAESPSSSKNSKNLRLPMADPPMLVLARLRFLLEYGEEPFPPLPNNDDEADKNSRRRRSKTTRSNLLPPHHLLYANSECIAVFCKTGRWSTLQASIFLHTSTFGNAKQTATMAMFLSSQTVTVPASGFWGWFGGTTTISLFTAQPWLVPALVGGGMVYVGLPMLMLWKAKGRWADTEKRLNDAFWSMYDSDVTVGMIRCWSGLEG